MANPQTHSTHPFGSRPARGSPPPHPHPPPPSSYHSTSHTQLRTPPPPARPQKLALHTHFDGGLDDQPPPRDATLPDPEMTAAAAPLAEAFSDAVYGPGGMGPAGKTAGVKRKAEVGAGRGRGRGQGQRGDRKSVV